MEHDPGTTLIGHLQNPTLFDHPVRDFEVIETHISWVLLTGDYAYKIKKPVNLGFLDFSTLDKRHHYCNEELRLNRRLAPELYLAVVPITGSASQPQLGGAEPVIEYAVKMRQFPQSAQLDRALARGELHGEHLTQLAAIVNRFHHTAAAADTDSPYGSAAAVWQPVLQSFEQIRPYLESDQEGALLDALQAWSTDTHARLSDTWAARKRDGFVRECHGDMHLGNMALIGDKILVFDCLEFNEYLRWIDVMSEAAFVSMDLYDRQRPALAHRFLNDYLQYGGDYQGLRVLRFYQVYRALVRAKVACLRLAQSNLSAKLRKQIRGHYRRYLHLAEYYTRTKPTPLIITHGLSGSGKTTVSDALLECSGAIRIRSDVERKRLFGLTAEALSHSAVAAGLYSPEAGVRTYNHLAETARTIIAAGYAVIVDAAFLKRQQRQQFRHLADELRVPFVIFHCEAPVALLRQRIQERQARGLDPSEASIDVLEHQLRSHEPLHADESKNIITINAAAT